jgi:hypothetical protein
MREGLFMFFSLSRNLVFRCISSAAFLALANLCLGQTVTPPQSTFFSTAAEEAYSTYQLPGDGDLWPSCWADDGNVYAASGDGAAFTGGMNTFDTAVSSIAGMPPNLTGTTVATNVGTNWSGPDYNRKPTGMLCIDRTLYLAFQNLNSSTFNDAPAASIAASADHGQTWTWDVSAPMFGTPGNSNSPEAYLFTTIFFLDYGQNASNAIDGYVYAYGLDNNWRAQQTMYLARVPNGSIQSRSAWEFYTGTDASGDPDWSADITQKAPVLTDQRLLYPVMFGTDCPASNPVIGQGGVVYDAPLRRYIFTSWSCATHELYEAPNPWGPWSHFLSNDFGPLRLLQNRGQYGTSIPSKFIGADGKTLYLQSNVCCSGDSYTFSLRKLYLDTYAPASPSNTCSDANLALAPGTRAISKSTHLGLLCALDCADQISNGPAGVNENDFDEEAKTIDWWGYTWPIPYNIDQVTYTAGPIFYDGGWYASDLKVQVRQNFQWVDMAGGTVAPEYPYTNLAANQTYTFTFPSTWGDGVRITGTPGGTHHFTSIAYLGASYAVNAFTPPANSPAFSLPAGTYNGPQTVTLSDSTAGAQIYFTTDGTTPTASSTKYMSAIAVSATETLQAIAVATNYNPSAVASATYTINLPGFSIAATPASVAIAAGQSGTTNIAITPTGGFNSAISFACSGLPSDATCSFSPVTVTPPGTTSTTLTVTASTASAAFDRKGRARFPEAVLALALCCLGWKTRRRLRILPVLAVSVAGLSMVSACGSGGASSGAPQPVTSTVTVTATAGSLQKSTTFSLTVN